MRPIAVSAAALLFACTPPAALLCSDDADCGTGACDASGRCVAPLDPPRQDAGPVNQPDAGPPVLDAGPPAPDAGPPREDAGPPDTDPPDAGPPCVLNGVRAEGEACDDGNEDDDDGCSAACEVEPSWRCVRPLGERSRCAPGSFCNADRRTVPLAFDLVTDLSAGAIAGDDVDTSVETRFEDLGGLGLVDLVIGAALNPRSDDNYALFDPEGGYRVRFVRAGTEIPLAILEPELVLVDLENTDAMGAFTFGAWGRSVTLPYTVGTVFSGAAVPVSEEWMGTEVGQAGLNISAQGIVDLQGFAVSEFNFAPSSRGSTIGLQFVGEEVTVCDFAGCGDGVLADPETCDDGNRLDGDGCSASCTLE